MEPKRWRGAVALVALLGAAPAALAQRADRVPEGMEGVGIDQLLDVQADLDATFLDDRGNVARLRDFADGTMPTILTFNFSDCPMICSSQLDALVGTLRDVDLMPGTDYRVVTVSLDANEIPAKARIAKQRYVAQWGHPSADRAWHFLTGKAEQIRKLADSVGYHYKYVDDEVKYAHFPALILLTPQARTARYIGGLIYQPTTLRYSLVEASGGKIGTITDDIFFSCFRYDPHTGKYSLFATNFMMLGGALTLVALGVFLFNMRKFESKLHGSSVGAEVVRP